MNAIPFLNIKKAILQQGLIDATRIRGIIADEFYKFDQIKALLIWGVDTGAVNVFLNAKTANSSINSLKKKQRKVLTNSGMNRAQAGFVITFCLFLIDHTTEHTLLQNLPQNSFSSSFSVPNIPSSGTTKYSFQLSSHSILHQQQIRQKIKQIFKQYYQAILAVIVSIILLFFIIQLFNPKSSKSKQDTRQEVQKKCTI